MMHESSLLIGNRMLTYLTCIAFTLDMQDESVKIPFIGNGVNLSYVCRIYTIHIHDARMHAHLDLTLHNLGFRFK